MVRDVLLGFDNIQRGKFFIAVGDTADRQKEAALCPGPFATPVHSDAVVADDVELGEGTVVMAGAVIQPGAVIGKHVIINTGATVDHDCVIEDYAHIAPGAHLCGGVHVGEGALVGVGVGLEPGAVVPAWHIVKREKYIVEPMADH